MRDFATMFFRRQTGAPAAGTPKNFHYWLSLCLVGTLLRLPALSVTYAPLVDYPNHLARVYIHGRRTWLVLPCCFFIYNSLFLYGFVNYNLGVSFFCLAFAYWLRRRENWTWLSLLASSVLVFCCYLAHLSAYAFLGVSFVVVEAWYFAFRRVSPRSVALGLIPLIPSLLTFAVFMRGSGRIGTIQWNTPAGAAKYLLIAYLVIASIRLGAIWNTWMTLDRRIAAEVERLKGLPQGSSVYVAFTQPAIGEKGKVERAFEHIAHYATIYRGSFVSGLYAIRGQQPLVTRPMPNYTTPGGNDTQRLLYNSGYFDYVWCYGESSNFIKNTLSGRSILVNDTDGFALLMSGRAVK